MEETKKVESEEIKSSEIGFMEYPSIEILTDKLVQEFLQNLPEKFDFNQHKVYITEKIHGTNFSIVYDTKRNQLLLCKRSKAFTSWFSSEINLIKDLQSHLQEAFFPQSVKHVIQKRFSQFIQLFTSIKKDYPDALQIHIFGELFGGQYSTRTQFNVIQTEIKYSNEPDFYLFDIFIDRFRLDCDKFYKYCEAVNYPTAPLLKTVTIHDILDIKEKKMIWQYKDFVTTIPKILGLEEIENNIAEGVVIKYHDQVWKSKSQKFLEVASQPKGKPKNDKKDTQVNPLNEFVNRITFPRLENVMIKEGNQSSLDITWQKLVEDINSELKRSNIVIDNFQELFTKQEDALKKKFKGMFNGYTAKLNKK